MDLDSCPHCHSETGYYVKTQIRGATDFRYKFDGSYDEEDNGHVHDSLTYKDGKCAYCRDCHKRIFKET